MKNHIINKMYHIEVIPPKQDLKNMDADLEVFTEKYNKVLEGGYCVCLTDNAMGHLAFQGTELIDELGLDVRSEQIMIHLNTFHTKDHLLKILDTCKKLGIKYILVVSGDGSERLSRLQPSDIGEEGNIKAVTSVELLKYIRDNYPDTFTLGAAFNPYEPPEHEFAKLQKKLNAGATFIVTQPVIGKNEIVDELLIKYPDLDIIIEAWMSERLDLLESAVGGEIAKNDKFEPIETLKELHECYPQSGFCLSLLKFKKQYPLVKDTWK